MNRAADVVFAGTPPRTFTLVGIASSEGGDNLAGATWQRFTNVTARTTNFVHTITDSNAVPTRFYRLVTPYQQ